MKSRLKNLMTLWIFLMPIAIDLYVPEQHEYIKSSSIWCNSPVMGMRTCHFRNLFFNKADGFMFLLSNDSFVTGLGDFNDLKRLKMSPIADHRGVEMKITVIVEPIQIDRLIVEPHFLLNRFKPDNLLHVIHDDLMPLFMKYRDICLGQVDQCVAKYSLLLVDNAKSVFSDWYRAMSSKEPLNVHGMEEGWTFCFSSVAVGVANTSFFQYGFNRVQGPMEIKLAGEDLKQFRAHFLRYFKINSPVTLGQWGLNDQPHPAITLISRTLNRKIINENKIFGDITAALKTANYGRTHSLITVNLLQDEVAVLLENIARSDLLISMHGAESVLAIFLPPGSVFIELFPFGISSENVSPIRSLSRASRIYFHYLTWHNSNEENSIAHPEYPPEFGGIETYSQDLKQKIQNTKTIPAVQCCNNPFYLYRMYQDTLVDDTFSEVALKAVEILTNKNDPIDNFIWYFPAPVRNLSCVHRSDSLISWLPPRNVLPQAIYNVYLIANGRHSNFRTQNLSLWVKETCHVAAWVTCEIEHKESSDSYIECVCPLIPSSLT